MQFYDIVRHEMTFTGGRWFLIRVTGDFWCSFKCFRSHWRVVGLLVPRGEPEEPFHPAERHQTCQQLRQRESAHLLCAIASSFLLERVRNSRSVSVNSSGLLSIIGCDLLADFKAYFYTRDGARPCRPAVVTRLALE